MDIGSFPHQVTRLVFDTGQPYEEFRARYAAAVPTLDERRLAEFAARGAAWSEVVAISRTGPAGGKAAGPR